MPRADEADGGDGEDDDGGGGGHGGDVGLLSDCMGVLDGFV